MQTTSDILAKLVSMCSNKVRGMFVKENLALWHSSLCFEKGGPVRHGLYPHRGHDTEKKHKQR